MNQIKLKQKLILISFGILVLFLLLEIGLRIGGQVYYSYRINNKNTQIDNKHTVRILCIGDSFTFGVGAEKDLSYPEQLEKILNNSNPYKYFVVYNAGIPGINSSQVFNNLEDNIRKYNPDVIIVMVGCNNNHNFEQSNYFLFMDKSIKTYIARLDIFLSKMRIYKLVKTAIDYLFNKIRLRLTSFASSNKTVGISDKKDEYKIINIQKEEAEKHIKLGRDYIKQGNITEAICEFKDAIKINPYSDEAYYILGSTYLHHTDTKRTYLLAAQALKKAIEMNPFNKPAHRELFDSYYRAGKEKLALEQLEIMHRLYPDEDWITRLLTYSVPHFRDIELFEKMLRYDLQNIIKLVQSKRIKLILQTYPCDWPNDTIREVANIYRVPLVDNQPAFYKLKITTKGYKRHFYFVEDGHCNTNGYHIIAQNIYKILRSELKEIVQ